MKKTFNLPIAIAATLFVFAGMNLSLHPRVNAEEEIEIELSQDMIDFCDSEGLNEAACFCVADEIMGNEGINSIGYQDFVDLFGQYDTEVQDCVDANH
ncbi:MAG: hypothetical protein J7647_02670 [Cyanobacteria bacterium SBLK]|nr:hypothetical protein [Cyanobacteria bacterium SBLK]